MDFQDVASMPFTASFSTIFQKEIVVDVIAS